MCTYRGASIICFSNLVLNAALRGHLVDIYLTKRRVVKDAINGFVEGKLERLSEPTRKIGTEQVEAEV